jgi:hypothetical protein
MQPQHQACQGHAAAGCRQALTATLHDGVVAKNTLFGWQLHRKERLEVIANQKQLDTTARVKAASMNILGLD